MLKYYIALVVCLFGFQAQSQLWTTGEPVCEAKFFFDPIRESYCMNIVKDRGYSEHGLSACMSPALKGDQVLSCLGLMAEARVSFKEVHDCSYSFANDGEGLLKCLRGAKFKN